MPEKTNKELIQEVWQGIYGVENTEENGMIGDLKDLKAYVKKQNNRITKLEIKVYSSMGVAAVAGAGILDATIWHKVIGG